MNRLRNMDVAIYLSLALLIQILSIYINNVLVFGSDVSNIDVFINSYGVTSVVLYIDLDMGLNNITLPIAPIEESISISCDGHEPPFVYENGVLYIVSDRSCNAMVSYIANISYNNNIFTLDITTPYRVVLTISRNILLISMPNNIVSIEDKRDNNTIITFLGPSTIIYTILPTTSSLAITMPTTITQSVVSTTPITIQTETQTPIPTSIQTAPLSISTTSMPTIETLTTQTIKASLATTTILTTTVAQGVVSPQTSIQSTSILPTTMTKIQETVTAATQSPSLLYQYLVPLIIIIVIVVVAIAIVFILRK